MIRCMLVKWSGITASKSDVFVWQKAPKGTLNPPVFGDLWPFPMMSVVDIPLSMLISLLPNQKTWNYIPLILNIYMFFTSHPPSTSITLGVSSYQVHGSHIRLWRGSSSYNQGYGRVICALESQSRFRWRLSSALPWGQPTSVFHMFFPIRDMRSWFFPQLQQLPPWLIHASATGFRKPWSWWRDAGLATGGWSFDCEVVQDWYHVPTSDVCKCRPHQLVRYNIYIYNIPDIPSGYST